MALRPCPICGKQISDKAKVCPKCGMENPFEAEEAQTPIFAAEESEASQATSQVEPTEAVEAAKPADPAAPSEAIDHAELIDEPERGGHGLKWLIALVVIVALGGVGYYCYYTAKDSEKELEELEAIAAQISDVVITPEFIEAVHQFDELYPFSEGMAAVKKDCKFGYINTKGELVIPCQFSNACAFFEGLAIVMDNEYNISILSKDGAIKQTPYKLDVLWYGTGGFHYDKGYYGFKFHDKKISLKFENYEEEVIIDENGNKVNNADEDLYFDFMGSFYPSTDTICQIPTLITFSAEKHNIYGNEETYYGIKDSSGKIIAPAKYTHIGEFSNGVAQIIIFVGQAETQGIPYGFHLPDGEYFFGYIDTNGNTTFTQSDFEKIEGYKNEQLNASTIRLDIKSLIMRIGNDVSIRSDWESQILGIEFVKGDTEKYVYEGDDKEASLYGSSEITKISEYYFLNIPNNHVKLIHKVDFEENFEIIFENKNALEEFIKTLKEFGYKESIYEGGIRLFDRISDEQWPAGIVWAIDGCSVRSINSDC